MPTEYDKLVRDRIPEIIDETDERAVIHVADDEEYADRLAAKLVEEALEFEAAVEGGGSHDGDTRDGDHRDDGTRDDDSREFEELADVLEVVHAILESRERSMADLERCRREKRSERGGFEEGIVLERVEDGSEQ